MAKVLITLIGTGKNAKGDGDNNRYKITDYKLENSLYEEKTLVSQAIIEHFNIDKAFYIGTNKSMWDNLCEIYNTDEEYFFEIMEKKEAKDVKEEDLVSLSRYIDNKLGNSGSHCYIIKDSESEDDLWIMFDKFIEILKTINKEDEVYFDVTHLFRSVSILSFIMAEFGKITKEIQIKGVFYGLLKKDPPSVIVNLATFYELLDWARAIKNLKEYGNGFELYKLIQDNITQKEVVNSFKDFNYALSISDMGALQNSLKQLKGKIIFFKENNHQIIKLISNDLEFFIDRFSKIDSLAKFQYELAKWYGENRNYAMGYLTLTEAIVSAICENNHLDPLNEDDRKEAKEILYKYGDWKKSSKEEQKISQIYYRVNSIRVNIAHKLPSNNSRSKSSPKDSVENFAKYIDDMAIIFKDLQ